MPNSYVGLGTLKGTGALNFAGTVFDARLLNVAEAVSRQIDAYCHRIFYVLIENRDFDVHPTATGTLWVGDLVAVGTVLEDTNEDGTFETGWAATDYILYPLNAQPTSIWGRPFNRLVVNPKSDGTQDEFLPGKAMYRITGTWGYREDLVNSGELPSGTWGAATATTTLTLSATTTLDVGQTIKVDSEYMYVTGTGATSIIVQRAVNGSTATAHTGTVNILRFPQEITEACLIQTSRLWKRRDSGFSTQVGMEEIGQTNIAIGLDRDVKQLLSRYRLVLV